MHIVNAMFGKGLGGIEQALVDYCEALKISGHKVTAIISPKAKIKAALVPLGVNIIEVKNFSAWDIFAKLYLKKIIRQLTPDAIICHGNRAASLVCSSSFVVSSKNADSQSIKIAKSPYLIGVTHNYSIQRLIGLDAIFATTEALKSKVIAAGQSENKVFKLPNMVRVVQEEIENGKEQNTSSSPIASHPSPLKIGTMGRFVPKKGFDVFIRAIAEFKKTGIEFQAVIGGSGAEEANLKKLANELGLASCLTFIGWVKDKEKFFVDIDIFVLPSIHEPFGIILLEAFAHKKPVIVTDSEGPGEIAENESDAIIVPINDSKALSAGIARLASDSDFSKIIAKNGFAKAITYDIKNFAASLSEVLIRVVKS